MSESWLIRDPGRISSVSLWDEIPWLARLTRVLLLISVMQLSPLFMASATGSLVGGGIFN